METKISGRVGGERNYFEIDDGHTMKDGSGMSGMGGSGMSGGKHTGTLQPYMGADLGDAFESESNENEGSIENDGVGAMPYKAVGSMAMDKYGADLGPNATNSLGTFDGTSDSMDPMLAPRPGTAQFRI